MKIKYFFILILILPMSLIAKTKEDKVFSLDELMPGGKNYAKFSPQYKYNFQWWGDNLIIFSKDSVFISDNPMSKNKKLLFNNKKFKTSVLKDIKNINFPIDGSNLIKIRTKKGFATYDIQNRKVSNFIKIPDSVNIVEPSWDYKNIAFTQGYDLFVKNSLGEKFNISKENNEDIVFGDAVHQREFGISKGIFWSPDNQKIAFYRMDQSMVESYPIVDFSPRVAKARYVKYPMAGMKSHQVTLGVYDLENKTTIYLKTGLPKEKYLTNIAWSLDSKYIFIAELNREQNHMKLVKYDGVTGDFVKVLFEEKSNKYVDPTVPMLFVPNHPDLFVWQSNRDGYNQLYLYNIDGKVISKLTTDKNDVTDVFGFDKKGENLFFQTTKSGNIESYNNDNKNTKSNILGRYVCKINILNYKIDRIDSGNNGTHSALMSYSGKYFLDYFSSHNNPGAISVVDTKNKRSELIFSCYNFFEKYSIPSVELGSLKASDNKTDLFYRILKPANFDPSKKYPVVIYVYGGPHSQMVSDTWMYGTRGWEIYMAQKGNIVFVMDNRGTSYRGFKFENVTHRRLGVIESKDQIKGVEFLKKLPYVDSSRIGIHGWSFGGFMTINMMLRYPNVFKVGVAGGPVMDWKYYEIMYGERYMDRPSDNPKGYEESSLLNKVGNLKGRLLIIDGDQDPVVLFQHTSKFLKASVKAGVNPDLFIYPNQEHNVLGPERVHLYEHVTRYFDDFL